MIVRSRPDESRILAYLARRRGLSWSYPHVGATLGPLPPGYVVDHSSVRLGQGARVFDRACEALRDWAMFRIGWVEVHPHRPPIAEGTDVALLARAMGVWALFACRIVRVFDEHGAVESSGFAYGTLPGHWLAGEERFLVRWDHADDSVAFDVLAYSRPAGLAGQLTYPLLRRVQRRFAPAALRAMTEAVSGGRP
jgi:uncharacterized protein (UPF0548 family)